MMLLSLFHIGESGSIDLTGWRLLYRRQIGSTPVESAGPGSYNHLAGSIPPGIRVKGTPGSQHKDGAGLPAPTSLLGHRCDSDGSCLSNVQLIKDE